MNVVQLPQQLRSCSNVTRDATATLGVATGSNRTEASQLSAAQLATAAVAANQVCIMWMQPSCN